MRHFIGRDLVGVTANEGVGEGDLTSADDRALRPRAAQRALRQAGPEGGEGVELGLKILELEREIQDLDIQIGRAGGRVLSHSSVAGAGAGAQDRAAHGADSEAAAPFEEVAPLVAPLHPLVEGVDNEVCF